MKALMVAIQPKWLKMILDGTKKFEFRNWEKADENIPVGTVLYFYESQGKRKSRENWEDYPEYIGYDCYHPTDLYHKYVFEGRQQVVAKAVVKSNEQVFWNNVLDRCYTQHLSYIEILKNLNMEEDTLHKMATGKELYAIELSQVEEIEPKDVTEFVSWSKSNIAMCDVPLRKPPQSRTWIYVKEE